LIEREQGPSNRDKGYNIPRISNPLVDAHTKLAFTYRCEEHLEPLLKVRLGKIAEQASQEVFLMDGKSRTILLVSDVTIPLLVLNGYDNP
jgi:hypothetical protein